MTATQINYLPPTGFIKGGGQEKVPNFKLMGPNGCSVPSQALLNQCKCLPGRSLHVSSYQSIATNTRALLQQRAGNS